MVLEAAVGSGGTQTGDEEESVSHRSSASLINNQPSSVQPSNLHNPAPLPRTRSKPVPEVNSWAVNDFIAKAGTNMRQRKIDESKIQRRLEGIRSKLPDLKLPTDKLVRNVVGDGNCMFRAISMSLSGKEDDHVKFRQDTADNLSRVIDTMLGEGGNAPTVTRGSVPVDKAERWRGYLLAMKLEDPEWKIDVETSIEGYIALMRQDKVWAGSLEMRTMAQILNRAIKCINFEDGLIHEAENTGKSTLYIFFLGDHFYGFW